jgi:hypothetical protein
MMDKLGRLASFIQKGQLNVADEKVEDTLLDLANYCVILAAYLQHKTSEKHPPLTLSTHTSTS